MNICPKCQTPLSEKLMNCPACGSKIVPGKTHIDDYRIVDYLHEGYGSILYRARKQGETQDVLIRIFKPESGIDAEKAARLKAELDDLRTLPPDVFVRHLDIRKSSDGDWYRVSEWIETLDWGDLLASGFFTDYKPAFSLFAEIASALARLHATHHCIPHLILSDILVFRNDQGDLSVKIDYKLSRFIDPGLDRPASMLQHLVEIHPDIQAGRPFDSRFDIWALGKIFVELLTRDHDITDFKTGIQQLPLPEKAKTLIREMLEKDPELRPGDMNEIAESLKRITADEIEQAAAYYRQAGGMPAREVKRLEKWLIRGVAAVLLLVVGAILLHMEYGIFSRDDSKILARYAGAYENSIVYILTEYWLMVDGKKTSRKVSEGTGFLVDPAGYIITNRHVACPWLTNPAFFKKIDQLHEDGLSPEFGYRHLVWFNGERAFYRHQPKTKSLAISDLFYLDTAHRSDGSPSVAIAGVIWPPHTSARKIHSPLQDDAAILKIDDVPKGAVCLPLAAMVNAETISPLSPVMVLGFPQGRKTIRTAEIRVSSTMGHVRRVFENELQMDASVYPGNSGGPIINTDGRVIGIASAVIGNRMRFGSTIQSDFSLGFPITAPGKLLKDLKAGKPKWNGVIDPLLEHRLESVKTAAYEGDWPKACTLTDRLAQASRDPYLWTLSGVLNICAQNDAKARNALEKVVSIDPDSDFSPFLLYILDWRAGRTADSDYRLKVQRLDWRSPGEIYGYLYRVLNDQVTGEAALDAWENRSEKALVLYIAALKQRAAENYGKAETLLRKALVASDEDTPRYFLIKGELDDLQHRRERDLKGTERQDYIRDKGRFNDQYTLLLPQLKNQKKALSQELKEIAAGKDPDAKLSALADLQQADPENHAIAVAIAFLNSNEGNWEEALQYVDAFLAVPGRESANRLGMMLLKGELLCLTGRRQEANNYLEGMASRISDPWYRSIARCLIGREKQSVLEKAAWNRPEDLLTLQTALGLWAEGAGDKESAIRHYNLAMESYLDNWMEYTLAIERINKLRRKPNEM